MIGAHTLLLLSVAVAAQSAQGARPTVIVKRPTVIAFFAHVDSADLDKNPDLNEALSDFQFYAASVRAPLKKKAGIDFQQISGGSFRVQDGRRKLLFHSGKIEVGYYFIAPGMAPRVEYGVMSDQDVLDVAQKYFNIPPHER